MKNNNLPKIMQEYHQKGEYWIDEGGNAISADGDIDDSNHIAYVINLLTSEITSHFGINDAEGTLNEYESEIKDKLIDNNRLNEEELVAWQDKKNRIKIIIEKLIEDKIYKTPEQIKDAVLIAYGKENDARDYAMKFWKWKIMKSFGKNIEIQTWFLTPEDLNIIVRGIWDISEDNIDDPNDPDNVIGPDGFVGPRVNVTVESNGKRYENIPLAVLEKKLPTSLNNYKSGLPWELGGINTRKSGPINESYHFSHKDYRMYEGNRHIVAVFEDGSRLMFEIHFRNNRGEDKEKWRRRAFTTWKSLANELHRDIELTEAGNPIQKNWKDCFKEALKNPKMKDFVRRKQYQKIFNHSNGKKSLSVIDPVNFTTFGS